MVVTNRAVIGRTLGELAAGPNAAGVYMESLQRGTQLMRFPVPAIDAAGLATAARLLLLMVVAAFLVWILFGVMRRPAAPPQHEEARQ